MGGTELLNCLNYIFGMHSVGFGAPKYKRQLFILTDGGVNQQESQRVLSAVKQNSDHHRVFSFGIGAGASTSLVNGLAKAGGGVASFVYDEESSWGQTESLSEICVKSIMASASCSISSLKVSPEKSLLAPNLKGTLIVDGQCLNLKL